MLVDVQLAQVVISATLEMALQNTLSLSFLIMPHIKFRKGSSSASINSWRLEYFCPSSVSLIKLPSLGGCFRSGTLRAALRPGDGKKKRRQAEMDSDEEEGYSSSADRKDPHLMDAEERQDWRKKIREVIDMNPEIEEDVDDVERRKKMQKLLSDYPLVAEEEDPDWPEDADGWGFNLGQFFDKITIKNKKKDEYDNDKYDSDSEIVWQDDNYIRPIKDITTAEWEEALFKDISPLIILVHNRYKRPKENEKIREELEKAIHIIWNCNLPSPRCVAVDAVVEHELVSALQVSVFPEVIFTKAGKIIYREKGFQSADELSKIMAFFYYGAAKPLCLRDVGDYQEEIPSVSIIVP